MAEWQWLSRLAGAALVALVAVTAVVTQQLWPNVLAMRQVSGRNNTILFITDSAHGLSNAHVATSFALLSSGYLVEVHYASFSPLASKIAQVSDSARARNPGAKGITWHELRGRDVIKAAKQRHGNVLLDEEFPPGATGARRASELLYKLSASRTAQEDWDLYCQIHAIINSVDPALVVVEVALPAGLWAARSLGRAVVSISPNAVMDKLSFNKFWRPSLLRYPVLSTGYPFPVPWRLMPCNMFLRLQFIYRHVTNGRLAERKAFFSAQGVSKSILSSFKPVTLISTSFPEAELPYHGMPSEISFCGPMVLDKGSVEQQDAELALWLKRRPTVVVNLGSLLKYNRQQAREMAAALGAVLEATDVQVLWKFEERDGGFDDDSDDDDDDDDDDNLDDFLSPVRAHLASGRLLMQRWLQVDPASLLLSGHVAVSVHHGGANSYYEAVLAGIPHVILPMWLDCYNFASTAEYLGIGIWPSKETAPRWQRASLAQGLMQALTEDTSTAMRDRAMQLGVVARRYGGRDAAAQQVAAMAARGR